MSIASEKLRLILSYIYSWKYSPELFTPELQSHFYLSSNSNPHLNRDEQLPNLNPTRLFSY